MMKIPFVLYALISAINGLDYTNEWLNFKIQNGKTYHSIKEDQIRFGIFRENVEKINKHNEKFHRGETSFSMAVNQFADLTSEEFKKMLGFQKGDRPSFNSRMLFKNDEIGVVPDFINWTNVGAVTDVKNQGNCGSCWSFSAIGSLEGQYFRKTGRLISFSAQNLVDCDKTCLGCMGGLMTRAFDYIKENGITTDNDYPYKGIDEPCKVNISSTLLRIRSYGSITENDEEALKKAVAIIGPISVAIDATEYFQLYGSGILNDTFCSNDGHSLNHGVLITGFGTENGQDYWIVKNSWGKTWGENGYIRMLRNQDNQCGIADQTSYPIF